MITSFPAPVLAVTADAVRELEGREALSSLWTLFTKCKESLQDGRRLENISWRLWYRDIMMVTPSLRIRDEEKSFLKEEEVLDEKSYRPPTPSDSVQLSSPTISDRADTIAYFTSSPASVPQESTRSAHQAPSNSANVNLHSPASAPFVPVRCQPPANRRASFVGSSGSMSVGKIICEMLPNATSPSPGTIRSALSTADINQSLGSWERLNRTVISDALTSDPRPTRCLIPPPAASQTSMTLSQSCLPTPDTELTQPDSPSYAVTTSKLALSSSSSTALVTPPTPTESTHNTIDRSPEVMPAGTAALAPPRLVVVNPTPGPTPHPTPPATPTLHPPQEASRLTSAGQYLTLPGIQGSLLPPPLLRVPPYRNSSRLSADRHEQQERYISYTAPPAEAQDVQDTPERIPEAVLDINSGLTVEHLAPAAVLQPHRERLSVLEQQRQEFSTRPPNQHRHSISSTTTTTSSSSHASSTGQRSEPSSTTTDEPIMLSGSERHMKDSHVPSSQSSTTSKGSKHRSSITSMTRVPSPTQMRTYYTSSNVSSPTFASPTSSAGKKKRNSMPPLSASPLQYGSSAPSTKSGSPTSQNQPQKLRASASGLMRRASSGGASGSGSSRSRSDRRPSKKSSASRSQSRELSVPAGLAMTTRSKGTGKRGRILSRGAVSSRGRAAAAARRSAEGRVGGSVEREEAELEEVMVQMEVVHENEKVKEDGKEKDSEGRRQEERVQREMESRRLAKFNIGSNSDDGSGVGSKSAGSGSDASGLGRGAVNGLAKMMPHFQGLKGKEKEKISEHILHDEVARTERLHEIVREKQKEKVERQENVNRMEKEKERQQEKVAADLVAAAAEKIKESLAAPLLPQQRRTIVLATSESEYETETDDGSWSSEEMSAEDVDVPIRRRTVTDPSIMPPQPLPPRQSPLKQPSPAKSRSKSKDQPLPDAQQPRPQRPATLQRAHSTNAANPRVKQHSSRIAQHRKEAQAHAQLLVEQAMMEAQRLSEMFAKRPTESFQDVTTARTQSVGLLTQLMNPPPDIFPVNHPYRRGYSSGAIRTGLTMTAPGQPSQAHQQQLRLLQQQQMQMQQEQERQQRQHLELQRRLELEQQQLEAQQQKQKQNDRRQTHQRRSSDRTHDHSVPRGPGLQLTKSIAALPVASRVDVGSVGVVESVAVVAVVEAKGVPNGLRMSAGGYRPRGPPKGQVLEEESENEADGIQLSKSIAEEKLKAFAELSRIPRRTSINTSPLAQGDDGEVPIWAREAQHYQQILQPPATERPLKAPGPGQNYSNPVPLPLKHPYNLPPPALPSTPRTTRRVMLQHEMSESLRRNLLWERQVSKANPAALRRTMSGAVRGNVLGGLRPLTNVPSMVQLTAKGSKSNKSEAGDQERGEGSIEERPTVVRNKSWADDYHFKGW